MMRPENSGRSRLTDALLETADDLRDTGLLNELAHADVTLHLTADEALSRVSPISGDEIRALRERDHLSQTVFAGYLNLTADHVSQMERGIKRPAGAILVLLNLIRRKGLEVIL
jgi:putative transcriptional regulator